MHKASKRVALLIGNSDYRIVDYKLDSPTIDVDMMSASLAWCGFKVWALKDVTSNELRDAFASFKAQAAAADVALLYYSGHGLQLGDGNVILPIDTPPTFAGLLALEPVRIEALIRETNDVLGSHCGTCLVFLDACRSSPANPAAFRSGEVGKDAGVTGSTVCTTCGLQVFPSGLSEIKIDQDSQTFIAYATSPGSIAEGIRSEPSRFTRRLERYLATPGLPIDDLMRWVADAVSFETRGAQRPWKHGNLVKPFAFKPPDWSPVKILGMLGFCIGVLTASLSFHDDSYIPLSMSDVAVPSTLGNVNSQIIANIPFAALIAYGTIKWGRGTWRSGGIAFAITYIAWLIGNFALAPALDHKVVKCHVTWQAFLNDPGLILQLDAVFAAGVIYPIGILAATAASSQSQRRIRPFAIAISVGFALIALYVVVAIGLRALHIVDCTAPGASMLAIVMIHLATGVWNGLLAAMSGYAYTTYVPEEWRLAYTELDRPASDVVRDTERKIGSKVCTARLICGVKLHKFWRWLRGRLYV